MTRDTKVLKTKEQRVGILRGFYKLHKMVTITADVMFVSGIPFLVMFSRNIKFWTAEFMPKRTARLIAKSFLKYCCYMHEVGILLNWPLWTRT